MEASTLPITEVAFSPDGTGFTIALDDGTFEIYRTEPLSRTCRLTTGWQAHIWPFLEIPLAPLGSVPSFWGVHRGRGATSCNPLFEVRDTKRQKLVCRWLCSNIGHLHLLNVHDRLFVSVHQWYSKHLTIFDTRHPEANGCHIFPYIRKYAHSENGTKLVIQTTQGSCFYVDISELLLGGLNALGGRPAHEASESAFPRISVGDERYDFYDPYDTNGSYFRMADRALQLVRGPNVTHFMTIPDSAKKVHLYLYPWRLWDPNVPEDSRNLMVHDARLMADPADPVDARNLEDAYAWLYADAEDLLGRSRPGETGPLL